MQLQPRLLRRRVTNIETLRLDTTALTQTLAAFTGTTITRVDVGAAGLTSTFTNASASVTTIENSGGTGTITLTRATDTASDSISIVATDDGAATTITAVTLADEETITLSSGDGAAEDLTVTTLTTADATSLVLNGAGDVVITNAIATGVALTSVDASGTAGVATVNASNNTSAITATALNRCIHLHRRLRQRHHQRWCRCGHPGQVASVNDTINGGAAIDTIDGGVGADTIDGGAAADIIDAGTGADSITGGAGVLTRLLRAYGRLRWRQPLSSTLCYRGCCCGCCCVWQLAIPSPSATVSMSTRTSLLAHPAIPLRVVTVAGAADFCDFGSGEPMLLVAVLLMTYCSSPAAIRCRRLGVFTDGRRRRWC